MGRIISTAFLTRVAAALAILTACGEPITKYQDPATPYVLYFEPERVEVPLQTNTALDTVELHIMIEKVTDLYAFDLDIEVISDSTENDKMLQLLSVHEGPLLTGGGKVSTLFLSRCPESYAHITLQSVRLNNRGVTTYEPKRVATVRLLPRSKGTISLRWRTCRLVDSSQPSGVTIDADNHLCRDAVVKIL